jgi:hypothetical protein
MITPVEVGTKLVKKDAPGYTLEVLELITPSRELPHARTRVSTSDRDLGVRLYSVSALGDQRLFIPVADAQAA